MEKKHKHGEWWCNKYNAVALPDEDNNCSLCGAIMLPELNTIEDEDSYYATQGELSRCKN